MVNITVKALTEEVGLTRLYYTPEWNPNLESEKFDTEKSIQKKMMVDIKPGNPGRARDKKWKIMLWQAVRQISFLGRFVHFFQF